MSKKSKINLITTTIVIVSLVAVYFMVKPSDTLSKHTEMTPIELSSEVENAELNEVEETQGNEESLTTKEAIEKSKQEKTNPNTNQYPSMVTPPLIKRDSDNAKLVQQWIAGDGKTPHTYQLWEVNGQEHLVVLPE